jgi:hypothetical protein
MSSEIYAVPEQIVYRNFDVFSQNTCQTRSLLIQNKTSVALKAYVSLPFTSHFKVSLHVQNEEVQSNCPEPFFSVIVEPGTPTKLSVELQVPDNEDLNYIQGIYPTYL